MSWIDEAATLLKLPLTRQGTRRATGPCPFCREANGNGGTDRFVVFEEGNYWCNQCDTKGWWLGKPPTADEIAKRVVEKREQTQRAYTTMHTKEPVWIAYHKATRLDLWGERQISEASVNRWGLGYCTETPYTDPVLPSLTIPIHYGGKLYDIRHRVIGGTDSQKYRSHLAGVQPVYFNLDNLGASPYIYLIEGEIKAIYLMQMGFGPCIAYPGVKFLHFLPDLIKRQGQKGQEFIALPDPGTEGQVAKVLRVVADLGYHTTIVDIIEKPDDFVFNYGVKCMRDAITYRRSLL